MKISRFMTAALVLAWFTCIMPPPLLQADVPTPATEKAEKLQKFYQSLTSLAFDFTQTTRVGGRERVGSGNAIFIKPRFSEKNRSIMRWDYSEPDKQVIINDGVTLSIYTDKDRQLIKTSARELESDITYAFFAGTRDLLEDFAAQPADREFIYSTAEDLQAIQLVPRQPHNQIKSVIVWADNHNIIRHMLIEDHFDSITQLNFENISLNSVQADDKSTVDRIISFSIPPGTEIITQ